MRKFSTLRSQDATDYIGYNGYLRYDVAVQNAAPIVDNDSAFYAFGDRSPVLAYSSSTNSYSGVLSLFLQQLTLEENKTIFKSYVLYPTSPSAAKSVNRAIFPKDKIKLKVYYTKPTTPR